MNAYKNVNNNFIITDRIKKRNLYKLITILFSGYKGNVLKILVLFLLVYDMIVNSMNNTNNYKSQ